VRVFACVCLCVCVCVCEREMEGENKRERERETWWVRYVHASLLAEHGKVLFFP